LQTRSDAAKLETVGQAQPAGTAPDEEVRKALLALDRQRPRRLGNILVGALIVCVGAVFCFALAVNPALDWETFGAYFFSDMMLAGVQTTLVLTAFSLVGTMVLAVPVAVARMSSNFILDRLSRLYVWFFRAIPLLVLVILAFNIALIFPTISLSLPFGPELFSVQTNNVISGFWAGVIAFSLHQSAYTSEIIRGALQAVPRGQWEASRALGLFPWTIFRRIVLPQAVRIAFPSLGNEAIHILKNTSMIAFISVADVLYSAQQIYNSNFAVIPLLLVATVWYLVLITALSFVQNLMERKQRNSARVSVKPSKQREQESKANT